MTENCFFFLPLDSVRRLPCGLWRKKERRRKRDEDRQKLRLT